MSTPTMSTISHLVTDAALLRCVAKAGSIDALDDLRSSDIDWPRLWQMAGEQQVQALVARVIDRDCLADIVPDEARQAAKAARLRTMLHNMAIHAELDRISKILHAHAIPVVPLKGTHLARRLFDDLGARRCGDIDILVPAERYEAARGLLVADGYTSPDWVKPGVRKHAFHGVPMIKQSPAAVFVLELHWKLTDPHYVTVDDAELWKRVLETSPTEQALRPLPAEHLLLFLTIHLSKHDHGLLRLLADVNQLILREGSSIDWDSLVELARRWSTEDMTYFGLSFAATLLGTPVPEDVLTQLRPAAWKRRAICSLTGPSAIMRPPMPDHIRISRFRIAYCLMLRSPRNSFRAYWQYILLPPVDRQRPALVAAVTGVQRPFVGLAQTSLAVGSSIRDQHRRVGHPACAGWCQGESEYR